jgi:hypothetical protein
MFADPVFKPKTELNGFAGKDCELFWSVRVWEYWKKLRLKFEFEIVFSILHHCIAPFHQQTSAWRKDVNNQLWGWLSPQVP